MPNKPGMHRLIIAVLALLLSCGCMAPAGRYPGWAEYEATHAVMGVAFDQAGDLWAGGLGGAVEWRPDGTHAQFTHADGLVNDSVWSTLVAPDGAVWFGTSRGVSRFDGTGWQS